MSNEQSHAVPEQVRDEIAEALNMAFAQWAACKATFRPGDSHVLAGASVTQYMRGVYGLNLPDGTSYKLVIMAMPMYHLSSAGGIE